MRLMLALVLALPALAAAQSPNVDDYLIFGTREVKLKDIQVPTGGCSVGTNCARPSRNAPCGVLLHTRPFYADGTQLVGDTTKFRKSGGNVWQIVTNNLTAPVNIRNPPLVPFTPPVIPDLDGDSVPSCDGTCAIDFGDFEVACGFPDPFPACGTADLLAFPGQDCTPVDALPGNSRCDPPPGAYRMLDVRNNAAVEFQGGDYALCSLRIGRDVTATGTGRLLVRGTIAIGNETTFGTDCHDLTILASGAQGVVSIGANAVVRGRVCAPARTLRLGNATVLQGRFLGWFVTGGRGTVATCCAP